MATRHSNAASFVRSATAEIRRSTQKKAPEGLSPVRRTSRRHAGIAIAGDAAAAPPTGRTGADARGNGSSEHVTGSGESVTAAATPSGMSPLLRDELETITVELVDIHLKYVAISDALKYGPGDGLRAEAICNLGYEVIGPANERLEAVFERSHAAAEGGAA